MHPRIGPLDFLIASAGEGGASRLVQRSDTGATPGTKGNDYAGGGTRLYPTAGIAVFQLGQPFGSPGEFQTQGSILIGKPGGLRQSGGGLFPLGDGLFPLGNGLLPCDNSLLPRGIDLFPRGSSLFPRNGGFILSLLGLAGVDYAGQHDAGAS